MLILKYQTEVQRVNYGRVFVSVIDVDYHVYFTEAKIWLLTPATGIGMAKREVICGANHISFEIGITLDFFKCLTTRNIGYQKFCAVY